MNTAKAPQDIALRRWLALFILALSTFTIVTTALAPLGLLMPIAEGNPEETGPGPVSSGYQQFSGIHALHAFLRIAAAFDLNAPVNFVQQGNIAPLQNDIGRLRIFREVTGVTGSGNRDQLVVLR